MTPLSKNLSCSPLRRATRLGTALVLAGALGIAAVAPATAAVNDNGETVTSTVSASQPAVVGDPFVNEVMRVDKGQGWSEPVNFQWLRDGAVIEDETWFTYTVADADRGHRISVRVTGQYSGKFRDSAQTDQAGYTPVISTAQPKISGTPVSGNTLSASSGGWSPAGTQRTYQWKANGAAIAGATAASFVLTPAQAGKTITVTVTATKTLRRSTAVTSAPTASVTLPVVSNTGLPTVSGNAALGQVLKATPGTWTNATGFAYQWFGDGTAIPGATAATYTVPGNALGKTFSVQVTGSQAGYTSFRAASAPTAPVVVNALVNMIVPFISGTAVEELALYASTGSWAPAAASTTFQWFANDQPIPGATAATFRPAPAQVGKRISVEVVASAPGYTATAARSGHTAAILSRTVTGAAPLVKGTAEVGQTLTGSAGTWTAGAALAYQWLANGQRIAGATGTSYTLTKAEVGKTVTWQVTGTLNGYRTYVRSSAASKPVTDLVVANTSAPAVTGSRVKLSTLTAKPGTWGPGTVQLSYQWLRNGQPIAGATSTRYTLTATDAGQRVTVRILGTRSGYAPLTVTAPEGDPVAYGYIRATGPVRISGGLFATYRLTAQGSWDVPGATLSYQWLRNGTAIPGATGAQYDLTAADVDSKISVRVAAAKAFWRSVSTVSAETAAIKKTPIFNTGAPSIQGSSRAGANLWINTGTWNVTKPSLGYQWYSNGKAIFGATRSIYSPSVSDVGRVITVRVKASKTGYASVTAVSAPTGVITR